MKSIYNEPKLFSIEWILFLNLLFVSDEVEVFPENLEAARLVYRSFGAPPHLHRDLTTSSTSQDS